MVERLMQYTIEAIGLSDIGLARQNNEDVWAQVPDISFFALADGMGGHQAGEIAAREAVNNLCRIMQKKINHEGMTIDEIRDLLRRAIRHINGVVFKLGRSQMQLKGMGTTLCCLLFHQDNFVLAHVGDSRVYRYRNGNLEQLTKDHSLLSELFEQGKIDERQALDFLYKNIITKAIGTEPKVEPTLEIGDLSHNDVYLMCSDGLSDQLSLEEIQIIMTATETTPLKAVASALVEASNDKGGRDNVTVVLAKINS